MQKQRVLTYAYPALDITTATTRPTPRISPPHFHLCRPARLRGPPQCNHWIHVLHHLRFYLACSRTRGGSLPPWPHPLPPCGDICAAGIPAAIPAARHLHMLGECRVCCVVLYTVRRGSRNWTCCICMPLSYTGVSCCLARPFPPHPSYPPHLAGRLV
jgi:hypothetical protein